MTYGIGTVKLIEKPVSTSFADISKRQEYFITPNAAKDIYEDAEIMRDRKGKRLGWIISIGALTAAGLVLLIMRGLPSNTSKWLQNMGKRFERKSAVHKHTGETKIAKFYQRLSDKLSNFADRSKSINNVTSFKDLAFKKLFDKSKFAKRVYDSITRIFEKMAVNTVSKKYKSSEKSFDRLYKTFGNINKKLLASDSERIVMVNGVGKPISQFVEDVIKVQTMTVASVEKGFGKAARIARLKEMHKACEGLDERVLIAGRKGFADAKNMKQGLEALDKSPITNGFIAADCLAADKEVILSKVKELLAIPETKLSEVLDMYKAILPAKEYSRLASKVKSALNKLNKASNIENDRFFDKLRDLTLGSAPTDVLSVLGSISGVAIGLSAADNRDERVSATLKYGIPIVGSVATSIVMTISLVSGIWSLLIGTTSGVIMNKIGNRIDKNYKLQQKLKTDNAHAEAVKAEVSSVETSRF